MDESKMFEFKVDPANREAYHRILDQPLRPLIEAQLPLTGATRTNTLQLLEAWGARHVGNAVASSRHELGHQFMVGPKFLNLVEEVLAGVGVCMGWPTLGWQPPRKPPST